MLSGRPSFPARFIAQLFEFARPLRTVLARGTEAEFGLQSHALYERGLEGSLPPLCWKTGERMVRVDYVAGRSNLAGGEYQEGATVGINTSGHDGDLLFGFRSAHLDLVPMIAGWRGVLSFYSF
ncbi:hypothetical protein BH09SUM1_BH09SUM1_01230 [soil metagenome]